MNVKKLILISALLVSSLAVASPVMADQYGETDLGKDITINKTVRNPDTGEWEDNLNSSEYKFNPNQDVFFKVTVKNTGDRDLTGVKMKDLLPDYLSYLSGGLDHEFDLKIDEEKVFYITARVYEEKDLPSENGVYCVVNKAEAWFDEDDKDQDTAQVCIKKEGEVLGEVTVLPEAGPRETLALIAGTLVMAIAGIVLLKK